jgi:hypothetical protein
MSVAIYEQNNYRLSEEKAREIDARVQRLAVEDRKRNGSEPAENQAWSRS